MVTIYTVTENNEGKNYIANDNASLASLGWLLYRTEKIRADRPELSRLTVLEGLSRLYLFAEEGEKNKFLHPINENEARNKIGEIMSASSRDIHVHIDYDEDHLTMTYEHQGEIHEITSPVAALIEAYSRSLLKNSNNGRNYLSPKAFEPELDKICEMTCLLPTKQADPDETQAPKMNL